MPSFADAIDVTYTSPDISSNNNGAPYPVWGGRDFITAQDLSSSPTIVTTAQYQFSPVTSYTFSTGSTIASPGSLTTGQQVIFTVQANDGSGPVGDAVLLLWLSTAASPGGTVTAVGSGPRWQQLHRRRARHPQQPIAADVPGCIHQLLRA